MNPVRVRLLVLALVVLSAGGLVAWYALRPDPTAAPSAPTPPTVPGAIPPPPAVGSDYRNTRPDVAYVGTAACAECHAGNHQSYLLTAHSKALADVDPAAEPPDGTFTHPASGRTYRVYRENGQLRHEELIRDESGTVVAEADYPVKYVVGSGHFCRTYLIEVDGFLHESPVTWYTGRGKYDMSPGYDFPRHWGFERVVTQGCMKCHSGGVTAEGGTVHKLAVREQAVGCESCHGPGAKHVEFHRARGKLEGAADPTIVNPARLSRPLLEAVCGECHQGSVATVTLRGRGPNDFRPGLPLSDVRVDYRAVGDDARMTVTGHFEQLRQSRCYTQSEMTCLTCHDPHAKQKPADPAAYYRQKCLSCHQPAACQAPAADRAKTTPADNCATCHMPKGDTDIPHLAFSHHRIGVHGAKPPRPTTAPALEPIGDQSHLSEADRQRNLGLAYLDAAEKQGNEQFAPAFQARALPLLEKAFALGLRDPETTQWLARLTLPRDPRAAVAYAKLTLEANDAHPEMRAVALMIVANGEFAAGNYPAAITRLEELVTLRRQADDWRFLGDCRLLNGQPADALKAFQKAVEIRPFRPRNHAGLAEAYRRTGDAAKANEHQAYARWLEANHQE